MPSSVTCHRGLASSCHTSAQAAEKDSAYPSLELFSVVLERVRKDYVDGQKVTYQDLVYGALKDSTSAPITGRAALVVVQTSPTGSVWTTATAGVASSTIESGTVPGTYAVTVTTPGVGLAYYRLSFGGVAPGYSPSQSSALQITGLKSNSSWSGVSAPASAPYGGSATYSATSRRGSMTTAVPLTSSPTR